MGPRQLWCGCEGAFSVVNACRSALRDTDTPFLPRAKCAEYVPVCADTYRAVGTCGHNGCFVLKMRSEKAEAELSP